MVIINCTQHNATPEQLQAGVVDIIPVAKRNEALTFESLPTTEDIRDHADTVVKMVSGVAEVGTLVMIGGAPFFMGSLEAA